MSESLRWKLCLGCLVLVALEAPQAGLLVLEDLAGPYAPAVSDASVGADGSRAQAALVAAAARPLMDASLFVFGQGDLFARSDAFAISNRYLLESGNDLDSDVERAGWIVPGSP